MDLLKRCVHSGIRCTSRRSYAAFPVSYPTSSRSSSKSSDSIDNMPTPAPVDVSSRLKTLHSDVVTSLLDEATSLGVGFSPIAENPTNFINNLQEMAKYYFDQGGKLIRPTVSLLMSCACNQFPHPSRESIPSDIYANISLNQYRIAMVSEMIHTASLVHDDVIDESDIRRGRPTANARWGNRQAVLVGDFILARATKVLCTIGQPKVISTMAEIVEDLVKGELMQLTCPDNLGTKERFQHYLQRTFYKTGSLFANSCKSVAMLAGLDENQQHDSFEFGRNLGLAFQLIDDVIDYISTTQISGKPTVTDLKLGLATCPALYAAQEHPELNDLINRRFSNDGDVETAFEIIMNSNGITKSKELAKTHCQNAIDLAQKLPNGQRVRDCLIEIVQAQLQRNR